MPSPFPGMDPYLEDPVSWRDVHHRLITYMADSITALLKPRYVAKIEQRLYVVPSQRNIFPDVAVRHPEPRRRPTRGPVGSGTTVLSDPPLIVTPEPREVREAFLEIVHVPHGRRVVAVLELLSPANKAAGSEGRSEYLKKQRELLGSPLHLLEIDLLRRGEYTLAVPQERILYNGPWDYAVSLHRAGPDEQFEVWPVTLRERLPRVRLPLAAGDPDAVLDIQEFVDRCYDAGDYADEIDYRRDPAVPLTRADADWADDLLRRRGLRPKKRPTPRKRRPS